MIRFNDNENIRMPLTANYVESYIKLTKDRFIFLSEDVSIKSAAELSALLLYLDNENHQEPITIYVHSNGGDAAGLANIYDVMQMISAPVKTVCVGKAYSAGAVILAAGSKGERYAMKSAKIMIHGIQFSFPIPGHDITTSKNYYEFVREENDNIMKILAHHTGHSLEKLKEDCKQDVWLSATEAVSYGLIDHII